MALIRCFTDACLVWLRSLKFLLGRPHSILKGSILEETILCNERQIESAMHAQGQFWQMHNVCQMSMSIIT